MKTLHVSFPMSGRRVRTQKHEGEHSMSDITNRLQITVLNHPEIPSVSLLYRICRNLILVDRKQESYYIKDIWYRPWNIGQISFIAGKVIQVEQYQKHVVHIFCEYYGGNNPVKGCFIVPEEEYEIKEEQSGIGSCEYIVGTCIRKTYKTCAGYQYNKYAHSGTTESPEYKEKTKMIDFCFFRLDR